MVKQICGKADITLLENLVHQDMGVKVLQQEEHNENCNIESCSYNILYNQEFTEIQDAIDRAEIMTDTDFLMDDKMLSESEESKDNNNIMKSESSEFKRNSSSDND